MYFLIVYLLFVDFTDEWIERSYTPVLPLDGSCHGEGSEVKLMVKLYSKGAMASILSSLHVGMDHILCVAITLCNVLFNNLVCHSVIKYIKTIHQSIWLQTFISRS